MGFVQRRGELLRRLELVVVDNHGKASIGGLQRKFVAHGGDILLCHNRAEPRLLDRVQHELHDFANALARLDKQVVRKQRQRVRILSSLLRKFVACRG